VQEEVKKVPTFLQTFSVVVSKCLASAFGMLASSA